MCNNIETQNGTKTYLPPSFKGSYRYLCELFNGTCCILQKYGLPDLFVTFTLNPNWEEIKGELKNNETYQDRPDLCVKVYHEKFNELMHDITKNDILGENIAFSYNTEYQQRGGIHTHIILWNSSETKLNNIEYAETLIWSTIPNPNICPNLHRLVLRHMIHTPCDSRSTASTFRCKTKNTKCKNHSLSQ